MENKFKSLINHSSIIMLSVCTITLCGCGGGGGGGGEQTHLSGTVAQGAVVGAVVFADHLSGAEANYLMDTDEATTSTTTDAAGHFTINSPSYDYVIVSWGGTDSITHQPAMQMLAPAGAANISPLTTLVALNPASQAVIESLGIAYDADISATITPAAAMVVQSIQTAVSVVTNALTTDSTGASTGLSTSVVNNIQRDVLIQVAAQIQQSHATNLTDPSTLATTITTAVTDAMTSEGGSTAIEDLTTIAVQTAISNAVTTAVTSVATNMLTTSGSSTTDAVAENTIVTPSVVTQNNTATQTATEAVQAEITVTPPANAAPTISGTPPTTVTSGTAYSFTPTKSDPDAGDVLTFSIQNQPSWATFNAATGALMGTPTTLGVSSDIVISVTDGIHTASLPAFSITVTSNTGGSGGTQ
ncbi:conserved hypothetical protein [Gammaproteobacteria bacterium]